MKNMLNRLCTIILVFFALNVFLVNAGYSGQQTNIPQLVSKKEKMAQKKEEQMMSAASQIVYSKNATDFNMFKGTKWDFTFTHIDNIITFNNAASTDSDGLAYLGFTDLLGNKGTMLYILSGAGDSALAWGISQPFYAMYLTGTTSIDQFYFFNRMNDASVDGVYLSQILSTGEYSDPSPLTGSKQSTSTWYKDADGDKYSDGTTQQAVSRPSGYYLASELTATSGDCNDNDAAIHPGATEICGDGKDNNCNGQVDEGCAVTQTWYKDADHDGYSDGTSTQSVSRPANYYLTPELTATSGDCNDNDPAIHPGATEICGDGKDNNCNNQTDEGCAQNIAAPSTLTAQATSSTQITLGWIDNSDNEAGFKIEKKTGSCGSTGWTQAATKTPNTTSHTIAGLKPNTSYSFRVKAYKGSSNSPYSNCASSKTALSKTPPSPTNFQAISASATTVNLSWNDNSTNETGFKIYRKTGSGNWALLTTTKANVKSFSDTAAANNSSTKTYQYYVIAYNGSGSSISSLTAAVPYQPANLTAAKGSTAGSIDLAWTDTSSNETGFEIYRKSGNCASASAWKKVATLSKNISAWTDTGLTSGSTYAYKIRAYAASGSILSTYGYSNYSSCATAAAGEGEETESEVTVLGQTGQTDPDTGLPVRPHVRLEHPNGAWADVPAVSVLYSSKVDLRKVALPNDSPAWDWGGIAWQFISASGLVISDDVTLALPGTGAKNEKVLALSHTGDWIKIPSTAVTLAGGKPGREVNIGDIPTPWILVVAKPTGKTSSVTPPLSKGLEQLYWTDREEWQTQTLDALSKIDLTEEIAGAQSAATSASGSSTVLPSQVAKDLDIAYQVLGAARYGGALDLSAAGTPIPVIGLSPFELYSNGLDRLNAVRKEWFQIRDAWVSFPYSDDQTLDQAIESALAYYAPWGIDLMRFLIHTGTIGAFDMRIIGPYGDLLYADATLKNPQENPKIGINVADLARQGVTANCYLRLYSRKSVQDTWVDWLKDWKLQTVVRWAPVMLTTAGLVGGGVTVPALFASADQIIDLIQNQYSEDAYSTYLNCEVASASGSVGQFITEAGANKFKVEGAEMAAGGAALGMAQSLYSIALLYGVSQTNWYMLHEVRSLTTGTRSYCPKGNCAKSWWTGDTVPIEGYDQIPPILAVAVLQDVPPGYPANGYPAQRTRLQAWSMVLPSSGADLHRSYSNGSTCEANALGMQYSVLCPSNNKWSGGVKDLPFEKYKETDWPILVNYTAPAAQSMRLRVPKTVLSQIATEYGLGASPKLADYGIVIRAEAPDGNRAIFQMDDFIDNSGASFDYLQVVIEGIWKGNPADLSDIDSKYDGIRAKMSGETLQTKLTIKLSTTRDPEKVRATGEINFTAKGIKDIQIYPDSPEKEHIHYAEVSLAPAVDIFGTYNITKWQLLSGDQRLIDSYNAGDFAYNPKCGTAGCCTLRVWQLGEYSIAEICNEKNSTYLGGLADSRSYKEGNPDSELLAPLEYDNFFKIEKNLLTGSESWYWYGSPGKPAINASWNSINATFDKGKVNGTITQHQRVDSDQHVITMQFSFEGQLQK